MQGLVCIRSCCRAVLVDGGVAVDLSGAVLRDNYWQALCVTASVLHEATARITLAGAEKSGNGFSDDADAALGETVGIALERVEGGVSRLRVMLPMGPPTGVRLSNNRGGASMEVCIAAEE